MKKRIFSTLLVLITALALAMPASAAKAKFTIGSASVSGIDAPVAGNTPDYTATLGKGNYKLMDKNDSTFKNGITWYDCTDSTYVKTSHKFIGGHTYMVEIQLVPESGYSFSDSATGTVNGESIGEVAGGGSNVALVYEFPACQAPAIPAKVKFTGSSSFKVGGTAKVDVFATCASVMDSNCSSDMYNAALEHNVDVMWRCSNGPDKTGESVTWTADDAGKEYVCRVSFFADKAKTMFVDYIDSDVFTVDGNGSDMFAITTDELPSAVRGEKYSVRLKTNETETAKFQEDRYSQLSEFGLKLSKDGVISGTPSKTGNCHVNIIAQGQGGEATANYDITVVAPDPEITTSKTLPKATVGEKYSVKLKCKDSEASFSEYYNPGKANDLKKTGLFITPEGVLEGTPKTAGTFTFTLCAAGEAGEGYKTFTLTVEEKQEETTVPVESTAPTTAPTEPVESTEPVEVPEAPTEPVVLPTPPETGTTGGGSTGSLWLIIGIVAAILFAGILVPVIVIILIIVIVKRKKKAQ